jgi:hypothetical protein
MQRLAEFKPLKFIAVNCANGYSAFQDHFKSQHLGKRDWKESKRKGQGRYGWLWHKKKTTSQVIQLVSSWQKRVSWKQYLIWSMSISEILDASQMVIENRLAWHLLMLAWDMVSRVQTMLLWQLAPLVLTLLAMQPEWFNLVLLMWWWLVDLNPVLMLCL